jgi:hypothetical protein
MLTFGTLKPVTVSQSTWHFHLIDEKDIGLLEGLSVWPLSKDQALHRSMMVSLLVPYFPSQYAVLPEIEPDNPNH